LIVACSVNNEKNGHKVASVLVTAGVAIDEPNKAHNSHSPTPAFKIIYVHDLL
jgi:hypothetical protein